MQILGKEYQRERVQKVQGPGGERESHRGQLGRSHSSVDAVNS